MNTNTITIDYAIIKELGLIEACIVDLITSEYLSTLCDNEWIQLSTQYIADFLSLNEKLVQQTIRNMQKKQVVHVRKNKTTKLQELKLNLENIQHLIKY